VPSLSLHLVCICCILFSTLLKVRSPLLLRTAASSVVVQQASCCPASRRRQGLIRQRASERAGTSQDATSLIWSTSRSNPCGPACACSSRQHAHLHGRDLASCGKNLTMFLWLRTPNRRRAAAPCRAWNGMLSIRGTQTQIYNKQREWR
jgi:hypothetical protein